MELEELKLFCSIDGTDEDTFISELQLAAEEYLINAGVNKDYTKKLYKLAIKKLTKHWFDNRMINIDKTTKILDYSLPGIITQLKYTQVEVI